MFCTTSNLRLNFSLFQFVYQKIEIHHKIKFNQEILTKLLTGCIRLISIYCEVLIARQVTVSVKLSILSNKQTVYEFISGVSFEKYYTFHYQCSGLKSFVNYPFYRFDLSLLEEKISSIFHFEKISSILIDLKRLILAVGD